MPIYRVLLIDDNREFLTAASGFLSRRPELIVLGATLSGSQGIELAEQLRPDVVLVDLRMPEMDGLEVTRQIKALPSPPRVLVVSMSASPDDRRAAEAAGADGFVEKWQFIETIVDVITRGHQEAGAPAVKPASPAPGRLRILVVDDDAGARAVLGDMLTHLGHDVQATRDGMSALSLVSQRPFDVIVCDMRMPGLDGPGLHRQLLRVAPALAHRMIVLTGDMLNPETTAFVQCAGIAALSKPLTLTQLDAAVRATAARPRLDSPSPGC